MPVVKYTIQIKDNATEEVRNSSWHFPSYMDDGAGLTHDNLDDGIISIWGEGNNQCDCNRALYFGYAIGLKYEDMDTECGDGGYSVNILKGDECIYSEF